MELCITLRCGGYPAESPLASGSQASKPPREGSRAFTHSSGHPQVANRRFTLYNTMGLCLYYYFTEDMDIPVVARHAWGDGAPHLHDTSPGRKCITPHHYFQTARTWGDGAPHCKTNFLAWKGVAPHH